MANDKFVTAEVDDFRPEQAQALLQRVPKTWYVPIFGGDLNLSPPDDADGDEPKSALVPVYAGYEECDRAVRSRAGLRYDHDPVADSVV